MLYPSSTAPKQAVIFVGEGVPYKSEPGARFARSTYHSLKQANEIKAAGGKVGQATPPCARTLPPHCYATDRHGSTW